MVLSRNVGGRDRQVRGVVGAVMLVVAVWTLLAGNRGRAAVVAVAGAGLLFNAVTCFCGINALLGVDTSTGTD